MVKQLTIVMAVFALSLSAVQAQTKKSKQEKKKERAERIAQLIKQEEEGALIFTKQNAFGFRLATDGYGFFFEKGKYKTITKTNLWWLEFGERRDPKEEKRTNLYQQGNFLFLGNPYVFGKINNFYNFKIGIGQQRLIGGKGNKNGVAVSAIYGGGFALGMLKPYYLNVVDPATGGDKNIRYVDDKAMFLDPSAITGAAGFTRGFNQIDFVPGAHARLALRFDYGRYNEMLSAIEAGLNAEYYTKEMQQMALNTGDKFFFKAYVSIVFGKRK